MSTKIDSYLKLNKSLILLILLEIREEITQGEKGSLLAN
jgi:hypothetical protein